MTGQIAFELRVPPSWQEIELSPRRRDAAAREFVMRRIEEQPSLHPYRSEIVRSLRNSASRAHESGAVYLAVFTESAGDAYVPGSVSVTLLPSPPGAAGRGDALDAVVEELQDIALPGSDGEWRSVTTVEVPEHGGGARTYGVEDVEIEGGVVVRNVLMRTFVPVPDGVLLVSCASPALDLAEPLLELFSLVSDTLRITSRSDA